MSDGKATVLLIVGAGRSGSTLLSRVLGQVDHFFTVGELAQIWQAGLIEDRMCGCGVRFSHCELWRNVLERAFGPEGVDAGAMLAAQRRGVRVRQLPLILFGSRRLGNLVGSEYGRCLTRLYTALTEATGCRVIVDSSKLPLFGAILQATRSLDLYVVHLVRDPRATAYSWSRNKAEPDRRSRGRMVRFSALKSSALWDAYNVGASVLGRNARDRYIRIRYEDFVVSPHTVVRRILHLVGRGGQAANPFIDERTVMLRENHTILGNPNRLTTGATTISADEEWMTKLGPRGRMVSTLATLPLLKYFGYPLRPTHRSSAAVIHADQRSG